MSSLIAIFEGERGAAAASAILADAGYSTVVFKASHDPYDPPMEFQRRNQFIMRTALRWGIIGALVVEIPALILLFVFPLDLHVKVLMGSTVWKFGAGFGGWLGAAYGADRGLDSERAEDYERLIEDGRRIVTVAVAGRDRPSARGALLESGAIEVRDLAGTLEPVF